MSDFGGGGKGVESAKGGGGKEATQEAGEAGGRMRKRLRKRRIGKKMLIGIWRGKRRKICKIKNKMKKAKKKKEEQSEVEKA